MKTGFVNQPLIHVQLPSSSPIDRTRLKKIINVTFTGAYNLGATGSVDHESHVKFHEEILKRVNL